ncbi:hypothetical protein [Legionella fairfieldensis]|uniref:hypothetical protein n=1 Tax=Legionella fairfieldensis TaxID=45064 RepID=UPI0004917034|nr:hypothetical protein [Legionella fairfieldensis]
MIAVKRFSFFKWVQTLKMWCIEFKKERMLFRLALLDVRLNQDNNIELDILVSGIKNQIIQYNPEEIVFNDHLLTEFSPCDVRAITYLSFQKYIKLINESSLLIQGQYMREGKTVFVFFNWFTKEKFEKGAIEAYQDYDLLNDISKKDMINVVSTAIQEQSLQDFNNMS